jgi:hypothetical protein
VKARLAIVGLSLVLAACTAPTQAPMAPASTQNSPSAFVPATPPGSTAAGPTPSVARTPSAGRTELILSGTAIGDLPLGAAPQSLLEPDLVSRLGKPKAGPTQVCQLAGDRNRFALFDHSWSGFTVHYGRRAGATIAIGWAVALDRVPDGLTLVDRLPWRPTFADLAGSDGVEVESSAGVKTARLTGRAISYTGQVGAPSPDTVTGGPELACR